MENEIQKTLDNISVDAGQFYTELAVAHLESTNRVLGEEAQELGDIADTVDFARLNPAFKVSR